MTHSSRLYGTPFDKLALPMSSKLPTLTGLNHVTLSVSDLDRSLAFYVGVLGFHRHLRWARGAYLGIGDFWLCLSLGSVTRSEDYSHFALTMRAADRDRWQSRLDAHGIPIWQTNVSEGESIYFLDPDGHRLELHAGTLATRLASVAKRPYDGAEFSVEPVASASIPAGRPIRVAALSGSVRAGSINTRFVRALADCAPETLEITPYARLAELPLFDPDIDTASLGNAALDSLIEQVREADVVITACPEYARGLPGAFKNALDHLVGTDAFVAKSYVQYNLAPRASIAQASLQTVLETMSGLPLEPGPVVVDLPLSDPLEPEQKEALRVILRRLEQVVRSGKDDRS